MNGRLFILAILIVMIIALYPSGSVPGQENVFRMTLGGDCSADRATGDLYNSVDPYCVVDRGSTLPATWSMAPNRQGSGVDGNQVEQIDIEEQGKEGPNTTVDEQTSKQPGGNAGAEVEEPTNSQGGNGLSDQRSEPPNKRGKDGPNTDHPASPRGKDNSKDAPEEQSEDKIVKHPGDPNDNPAKNQKRDDGSTGKQCKKAERNNTDSQDNHNCYDYNPDDKSDKQRNTDHNPPKQAPSNDQGKNKEKKD